MTTDDRRLAIFAMGAVGGSFIGYHAYQHLFVEGLTEEERSNLLRAGIVGLSAWFLKSFVDLSFLGPYKQWIDPAGVFTSGT